MYISAIYNKRTDTVDVWERNEHGIRVKRSHSAPYYMYQYDPAGTFKSMTGLPCKKIEVESQSELDHLTIAIPYKQRFESDFTPIDRILMDVYSKQNVPTLNIGFFDIEVDYDPAIGFSSVKKPYAPINAITIYSTFESKFITLAVPPKSWNKCLPESLKNVMLFKSEKEMLNKFLEVIHPIDILSGWNSEFFDIPYIAKRIELVLGESAISRLSFENAPLPRWSEKERFKNAKSKDPVLIMQSRIHLDYMQLFRKFNLTPRQSYSLNAIGLDELNVPKIDYPGTLADLYNNDFELFLEYNIHDVRLVRDIDSKLKYINLANQMIHMASVNFDAIFGSVHLIDSAIITYAHNVLNVVVIDRQSRPDNEKVEGALVVTPKPGKYRYIGSVDLNSLYPNTIRSIGLSPEKIVGQFIDTELAWNYISRGFKGESLNDVVLKFTLDNDIGKTYELNVSEIVDLLKENKWSVSGYGTILDQGNGIGILPSVLGYWFKGRKELQAEKKKYSKLADQAKRDGDNIKYEEYQKLAEYYDMLQGVRKVLLNSTYGALLNAYMRFGDPRLGASTTYTGRQISTHMINTISSILTSDENYNKIQKRIVETKKNKRTGEVEVNIENEYTIELNGTSGIIYGDTDSVANDSLVELNGETLTIESHFEKLAITNQVINNDEKQMIFVNDVYTNTFVNGEIKTKKVKGVYRHKANKQMFKVNLSNGNSVTITEDHSIMVLVNGKLIEKKPTELLETDILINKTDSYELTRIKSIERIDSYDEYVYDVIMEDSSLPWFFANNVLVHNSCYFTMEGLVNNIDESIELANGIADYVNSTFDNFMKTSFNCQDDYLGLIKVAREIVAHSGIFQAKKKYMLALADKEGKRVNQGDDDELKTMGSDIKLSSTPDIIKEFLKKIVMSILYDVPKENINQMVIDFRNSLHCNDSINPLDIATIMNVKELDEYQMKWELIEHTGKGKVTIPAHVRAAINFNHFIKKNQFHFEQELISGNKVKVVWLKENPYNFNAIAFSSDEERFPEWFKQYFEPDIDLLEQKLVDQKLDNIFVALNWMVPTQQSMLMSSLLDIDETRKEKKTKRKPKAETKTFGLEF